jgi:hypothetical protein
MLAEDFSLIAIVSTLLCMLAFAADGSAVEPLRFDDHQRYLTGEAIMNYAAFTSESLVMMYEAIRGALAADDAAELQGVEPRFRVRETPDWKMHAADLESEDARTRDALQSHRLGRATRLSQPDASLTNGP